MRRNKYLADQIENPPDLFDESTETFHEVLQAQGGTAAEIAEGLGRINQLRLSQSEHPGRHAG